MTFTKEKNETSPRGRATGASSSSCRTARRRERRDAESALHDASRRRRGAPHHRREGRRRRISRSAATDGGWSIAAARPAKSSSTRLPVQRHRDRRRPSRLTKHPTGVALAVGARRQRASISSRPTGSTTTRRRGARRNSPSTSATRDAGRRACGRSTSPATRTKRLTEDGAYSRRRLHDLETTASGSASAACSPNRYKRNITAGEPLRRSLSARAATGRSSG